jgi:hypothetical protein
MAKQDSNPPEWSDEMGDGCSGVPDWLPFVGDMTDCCNEHDRAYHYGGTIEDFQAANKKFYDCIRKNKTCWFCYQLRKLVAHVRRSGVRSFGRRHFNWLGPGLPD